MGYNKVIVNGVTKVDLTSDTVSPDTMLESTTAHNAAGDLVTGTIPVNPQLSVADGGAVIVPQGYYSGSELIGYLLPIPTAEDAKKVVRVNDSGTGYELVDPSELNGPVGVTETVTGNPAVLLNSIGGQKLRGLKIYGKSTQAKTNGYQLFDANTVQYGYRWGSGGLENVEGSTEQYWASAPIPVVAGSTYTVTRQNSYRNFYLDESESVLEEIEGAHGNSASPHTFTVPEAAKFAVFTSKLNPEDEGAVPIDPKNVMLNLGPAAIPYEPYTGGKPSPSPEYPQEIVSAGDGGSIAMTVSDGADQSQSLTISTPNGLPGIHVDSGGNYTDTEGQQWVCDVKDYGTGKYTQMVGHIESYNGENITTPYMSTTGQLSTGAEVYYVLNEPVVTDISADELAAYRVLHTYDSTTVITPDDALAEVEVDYLVKSKAYIEKKLTAIESRLNALEISEALEGE